MELRQLRYFLSVVEHGSFTRAAAALHVAQSGVSFQIRQLERELGEPLLDRSDRAVRLTAVGAAVLPLARTALRAVDDTRRIVDEFAGLVRGRLVVGSVGTLSAFDLPGLLADFQQEYPRVEVTLTEGPADRLLDDLRAGRLDVAVVSMSGAPRPGLAVQVIADQRLVAVVATDDDLAARTAIEFPDLADRSLISFPRGSGVRAGVDAACAAAGVSPHIRFEASDPLVLVRLAARGMGVAIVPEVVAHARRDDLHILAVTRPTMRAQIVLAWPADATLAPTARTLIRYVRARLPTADPAEPTADPAGD